MFGTQARGEYYVVYPRGSISRHHRQGRQQNNGAVLLVQLAEPMSSLLAPILLNQSPPALILQPTYISKEKGGSGFMTTLPWKTLQRHDLCVLYLGVSKHPL